MNDRVSTLRCLTVWVAGTVAAAGLALLAAPVALAPAGPGFDRWLVRGCAVALLACVGWLWLGSSLVLAAAARGRTEGRAARLLPSALRRSMLAACGVAVLTAGPVAAEPGSAPLVPRETAAEILTGLPLPARPLGGLSTAAWANQVAAVASQADEAIHVVRPGDSLWSIAASTLRPGATDAEIDSYWRTLHAHNRDVVGADPALIHPGQRLTLPPAP
ncbi:LysM peptidoglycan-binding domain-containing protein [Nocardioides ferulae]|uniref:LysM peptidoglycan-binding domain-containing protein n=1 Tax=Nocardioides ferulae TaxID=2340821 RepID=UPI000EB48AB1|nr:LysM peptidoglycan-binding domain-containing protein [Nocardioides ferulae]